MGKNANSEALVPITPELLPPDDASLYLWQRRPDESIEHYRLFKFFCHMVDFPHPALEGYQSENNRGRFRKRSLLRVIQQCRVTPTLVYELAAKYEWEPRAKSYDAYMVQREQEALEVTQYAKAQIWAERKEKLREKEWQTAEKLIEQGMRMINHILTWPLVRETIETNKELTAEGILVQTIINKEPAQISLQDVVRVFELASKLGRLAAGMSQGDSTRTLKFDFKNMPEHELEKLADGEMP